MSKTQLLKQLSLPESASELELVIELANKVDTTGFLVFENFDMIQILPGESVRGKVNQIVL